ncbi:MAG: CHASE2 domain-containing protein, partial [Rugosibacter sp.]|nr:CHASE2 domain-containing protein [Rugosibacter sp.]
MSDRLSALLILLITSLVVSISGVLSRWDDLVYDVGQKLYRQTVPADLVIVGIDEESLVQLGRWPWSR